MSKEIATEIVRQLGGPRFIGMTGAKNFSVYKDSNGNPGLSFLLSSRSTKNKASHVKICLTSADDYIMTFGRVKPGRLECIVISRHEDIYAENLREVFTNETGLYCTL